jgi:HTH-type transcriptional regulator/antitoxin HigA
MEIMTLITPTIWDHWATIQPILTIHSEADYDRAVLALNELLDEVGTDEQHPLYDLLDTLGTVIAAYEAEHMQLPAVHGREALAYLMEEHNLRQSSLPEIGSQGVISEILSGKRELNVRQVRALAERFGVGAEVFI